MSERIFENLEETFGGIPPLISDNLKYFNIYSANENKFECVPCGKTVKTVHTNGNVTYNNFKTHIFSKTHQRIAYSIEDVHEALMLTFNDRIPQLVLNNCHLLDPFGKDFKCSLCDKILETSSDPSVTECSFSYHLLSISHKTKREQYKVMIRKLYKIFGVVPDEVIVNSKFLKLTRSGKNYKCTLCDTTVYELKDHFNSNQHQYITKLRNISSLIPNIEFIDSKVFRNIDYITVSGRDLFCNMCNVVVENCGNSFSEIGQNLKLHVMSIDHEKNVFSRTEHVNDIFNNINIFGEFSDVVLGNLRYLRQTDTCFSCSICKKEIKRGKCFGEAKQNIILHFKSYVHQNNFCNEMARRECLINSLEDVFGGLPQIIKENISFIDFLGSGNFQCTLCKAILQTKKHINDTEHVARITEENFERHLGSYQHSEAVGRLYERSAFIKMKLRDLFYAVPQFITKNLDFIEYNSEYLSFYCSLCDQNIFTGNGTKMEEITFHNFKTHFFSSSHISNLEMKAKRESVVTIRLKNIFGGIPNCVLCNVEYLYQVKDSYDCTACNVNIRIASYTDASERNFSQHLLGSLHKSNIETIEGLTIRAYQFLDINFCLPEFLLKEIDFFELWNGGLYCNLCQEVLMVEYGDMIQVRRCLKRHIESESHTVNVKNLLAI